ncbi:MAG TPA: ribosome biogenesis GTPase Der [Candidatus Dormibacteraeota bacterium]|nr:ribosome biogenesis GTPase Der [Candidatus Dormibacteraeota bacterium]
MYATVAIVGRPNVGKSALFNRLVGQRLAIVEDVPGVTRDRLYAVAEWRGRRFTLADTGGIEADVDLRKEATDELTRIRANARRQAEAAAREADVVVFVVDGREGYNPLDDEVALILRRAKRNVVFVANKVESPSARLSATAEFARLGFGEPIGVSAIHGEGTGDLLDAIYERLPAESAAPPEDELAIAIIGQPNVGKSSLLNALAGQERAIVSPVAGTTRDAIDEVVEREGRRLRLIDTAGIRRHVDKKDPVEYYSSLRSLNAISRSDVVLLLIDAMKGILAQDRRLAGVAVEERKALILVVNKWDLALEQGGYGQGELTQILHEQLGFASYVPVVFLSALTKRGLGKLLPLIQRVADNLVRRVPTPKLNDVLRDAMLAHPPPPVKGRMLKVFYVSQPFEKPPGFAFVTNDPELVHFSYRRYLENVIRQHFDFEGVPISLHFRERGAAEAT